MDRETVSALLKFKKTEERIRAVHLTKRLERPDRQSLLLKALQDRSNYVAALAAEALSEAADHAALAEMRERFLWLSEDGLARDPGCHIRQHLAFAFGRLEYGAGRDALRIGIRTLQIEAVGGEPFDVGAALRVNCALALAQMRDPDTVRDLAFLLFDEGQGYNRLGNRNTTIPVLPSTRKAGAEALARTLDPAARIPIALKLQFSLHEAAEVLQECMQALVTLEDPNIVELLTPYLLEHTDLQLAAFAALMLSQTRFPEVPPLLLRSLSRFEGDRLRGVALALSTIRSAEARTILLSLANHERKDVRLALIETLAGSIEEADVSCLKTIAQKDTVLAVRQAAKTAMETGG